MNINLYKLVALAASFDQKGLYDEASLLDSILIRLAMSYEEARKLLGISDESTDDEIKSAYRRMALQFHPDVSRSKEDEQERTSKMQTINEAYETLSRGPQQAQPISYYEEPSQEDLQNEMEDFFGSKMSFGWKETFEEAVANTGVSGDIEGEFVTQVKTMDSPDHPGMTREMYVVGGKASYEEEGTSDIYRVLVGILRDYSPKGKELFRALIMYNPSALGGTYDQKYDLFWLIEMFVRMGLEKPGLDLKVANLPEGTKLTKDLVGVAVGGSFKPIRDLEKQEKGASMIPRLFKLAYHLDGRGLYDEAKKIEEIMEQMVQRVGLKIDDMVALADHFDEIGDTKLASYFDNMIKEAAEKKKKGRPNKKDKGAADRPPGKWFDKMKKEIKKGNPDYSEERVAQTIGDIWYNNLSDEKREEIYKRHGEKKSPNKS